MSMRNLSKVLALVLSLAFVLTMFAGAIDPTIPDYLDKNELTGSGSEAVAVLSALGAVEGFPDGEFKPDEDVTRAQFAKMLSIADAGADVKAQYETAAIADYADIAGHWALPYLNYAYLNEIMVGYGDNTMRPDGAVTGFEAAKMTLVALGYDPKIEGLEGPAWQNNTAKLANRIGLLKNLEAVNMYGKFDREATAILVRNAIYTETVSYVGSYANGTGETLGEEVFDLIDVRGIVVANQYGAIGLNWEDVLTDKTNYNRAAYIQYTKPNAGETRFAYRDYTGAATEGGYYIPRVITTKIASDNADLGKAYRILATGAKNPTNTNEVRKVYGILGEIESDANYIVKDDTQKRVSKKDFNAIIDKMLASAQTISAVTENDKQGNIFIDGSAASYADAKALWAKQENSNFPYYLVDNDADGIYDFVYLYNYAAAKVLKVDGKKVTLAGVGVIETIEDPVVAEGDYAAFWGDNQYSWIKKLDTYTGKVTDYTLNSGNGQLTYAGGKYKINGNAYTFGWLSETFTEDERVYFQQLLGLGSSAVADATLRFVFEGSYIVAVFVDEQATHWDNYAIVIGVNNDTYLGMGHVRLLTEDNEYKDFYVASYNGQQVYNTIVAWAGVDPNLVNNLVRYEDLGNNQIALYTADYQNASYAYSSNLYMYFDQATGMWEAHEFTANGIQQGTLYDWKNGVVFVSYGELLSDYAYSNGLASTYTGVSTTYTAWSDYTLMWRAYLYGEFQPSTADEATPLAQKILFYNVTAKQNQRGDEVVYAAALNGVRTLKAAAITFDYKGTSYVLPGLPIRAGQAFWGTVMDATSIGVVTEEGKTKYAFTVKILNPWSGGTTTVTVYENFKVATFVKGQLYKMWSDGDGIVRRWELYSAVDGFVFGTDGLEVGKYVITAVVKTADGYILQAKKIVPVINPITGKPTGTVKAEEVKLTVDKDTDMYFVKNLFTTKIEAVDFVTTYGTLDYFSQVPHLGYLGYFDINPTTNKIFSGWINITESADFPWVRDDDAYKTTAVISVFYDTNSGTAIYTLPANLGVKFADGELTAEVECAPYELLAPVGDEVGVSLNLIYNKGAWYVEDPADVVATLRDDDDKNDGDWGYYWIKYDKYNAAGVKYTGTSTLEVEEPGFSMTIGTGVPYKFNLGVNTTAKSQDTQGFYVREGGNYEDQYAIYGDKAALAAFPTYFNLASAAGIGKFAAPVLETAQYAYNPDYQASAEHAYTYEYFYVMYNNVTASGSETIADANVIVYVDNEQGTSAHSNGNLIFPFA